MGEENDNMREYLSATIKAKPISGAVSDKQSAHEVVLQLQQNLGISYL